MADVNYLRDMVEYVQLSDAIATVVQKQASDKSAQDTKVNEMIPQVVEALIKNDRLPERLRKEASDLLRDPVKALGVLLNTANHKNASEVASMGEQTGTKKSASAKPVRGSMNSPYVGGRTTEERDSDRVLFERLGLR